MQFRWTTFLSYAVLLPALCAGGLISAAEPTASPADGINFARDIQPIFAGHCLVCHGLDKAEAGLRLTSRESATAELDSGNIAIVPDKLEQSELIRRITAEDPDERMPPEGDPLKPAEIEKLKQWIAGGADWQVHWAYHFKPFHHRR
jgi:hypothetical protein